MGTFIEYLLVRLLSRSNELDNLSKILWEIVLELDEKNIFVDGMSAISTRMFFIVKQECFNTLFSKNRRFALIWLLELLIISGLINEWTSSFEKIKNIIFKWKVILHLYVIPNANRLYYSVFSTAGNNNAVAIDNKIEQAMVSPV